MSEIPRLPGSTGDPEGGQRWSMDPNPRRNEIIVPENQPQQPENVENSESAEDRESKRLNGEIAKNYGADIFAAARRLGMPVEHSRDTYKWSNEDKQRLLDELANSAAAAETTTSTTTPAPGEGGTPAPAPAPGEGGDGGTDTPEGDDGDGGDGGEGGTPAPAPVPAPGEGGTPAPAPAPGEGGDGGNGGNGTPEGGTGTGNNESASTSVAEKAANKKRNLAIGAGVLAVASLLALIGIGANQNAKKETVETTAAVEEENDDDGETAEENESIHDISTYKGMFANEAGTGYNENKTGNHAFGEGLETGASEDEMKEGLGDRMIQPGQLAATYFYMQEKSTDPNFGVDGANFSNPDELLEAMEEDGDLHQRVYDYVMGAIKGGSMEESTVSGMVHNFYLDSLFETGDVDTSNVEVVGCDTQENGTKVYKLEVTWTDADGNIHTDTYTFKEACGGQPVDEFDFTQTVRKIPGDPEGGDEKDEDAERRNAGEDADKRGIDNNETPPTADPRGDDSDGDGVGDLDEYKPGEGNDGSTGGQDAETPSEDSDAGSIGDVIEKGEDTDQNGEENYENPEEHAAEEEEQKKADDQQEQANEQADDVKEDIDQNGGNTDVNFDDVI